MKKLSLSPKGYVLAAFVAVECIIYVIFNILAATLPDDPIYVKYAGILLCLALAVCFAILTKSRDAVILTVAFTFTAISDLFILILENYEVGVATFIVTQSIYLYRLYQNRIKKIWITLAIRGGEMIILLSVLAATIGLDFLLAEASIYIIMLVSNVVEAFLMCRSGSKNAIFAIGLLLFLGCDICVGLINAVDVINLNLGGAFAFTQFMIWIFYLPSQVLIACSVNCGGLRAKVKEDEKKE